MRQALFAMAAASMMLAACAPEAGAPQQSALPAGQWMTAEGAGETALIFVPEGGGGEIVAVCTLGAPPTFRIETPDAGFAAVATGPNADIVIGGLTAFEATLSRMALDGDRALIQATTPITEELVTALRAGPDLRLGVGAGAVQSGAAPQLEREAFAEACAAMIGLLGP